MSTDKEKAVHEKALSYLQKFMGALDVVETGLMKAHEAVGTAAEGIADFASDAGAVVQDGLMTLSDKLDEYRDGVWDRAAEADRQVYGDAPKDGCPAPENTVPFDLFKKSEKPVKPTADMSRDEKVDFLIKEYGLSDTLAQRDMLKKSSDAALTEAVDILKSRINRRK